MVLTFEAFFFFRAHQIAVTTNHHVLIYAPSKTPASGEKVRPKSPYINPRYPRQSCTLTYDHEYSLDQVLGAERDS